MSGTFLRALNTLINLMFKQLYEIETIINPILWIKKASHREVR